MKMKIVLGLLSSIVIIGCGGNTNSTDNNGIDNGTNDGNNGSSNNNNGSEVPSLNLTPKESLKTETYTGKIVLSDIKKHLMWANGKGGCEHINPGKTKEFGSNKAIKYCNDLTYAGFNDWRTPKINEIRDMTLSAYKAKIALYYQMSFCPRVVGFHNGEIQYVNTHNTKPVGTITLWKKGQSNNAGMRCVRDNN